MSNAESHYDVTEDDRSRSAARPEVVPHPFLFIMLEGDRPWVGGARYSLAGVDEIVVTRGAGRGASRRGRTLELELEGRKVSTRHARFRRRGTGWELEDTGSTNGSYVNGKRVSLSAVASTDLIELGRTFLSLSEQPVPADEEPRDRDCSEVSQARPGFLTLLPRVEAELERLERVAGSGISVVLSGETGTGKEVLARAVHALSGRRGELVAVNCSALTEGLAEAQLFGHVRGAFSGAVTDALGFVRAADGGTLLLDEVQELRLPAQATLLRVLQEKEVVPVGGVRAHRVDARVIATSPLPLDSLVRASRFRPDLFARLSGFAFKVRPVRERREDLGLLVASLLVNLGISSADRPRIDPTLALRLLQHPWPLNVRELEQLLRRAWVLARDGVIREDSFVAGSAPAEPEAESAQGQAPVGSARDLRDLEALVAALKAHDGHLSRAADAAGISRQRAHRLLERYPEHDPR